MSLRFVYEQRLKDFTIIDGHNIQCMPHLHRELELICLLEGDVVAYADSARHILHKGDVFLTFPNQIHSYEKLTPETHIGFIFRPDLLPELMETFTTGIPTSAVIEGACKDPNIRPLIDLLYATRERASFSHLSELRRGYLLSLCTELISHMTITRLSTNDSATLRTIVSFCTQNFSENLSLFLLEEKLHLNRFYISHLFGKKLGMGFNDYINSLRTSEACRYLINTDMSVTDISSLVGFNTPRTFNRAFIRQIGLSPTEYRRTRRPEIDAHIQNIEDQPRWAQEKNAAPTDASPVFSNNTNDLDYDPCACCDPCESQTLGASKTIESQARHSSYEEYDPCEAYPSVVPNTVGSQAYLQSFDECDPCEAIDPDFSFNPVLSDAGCSTTPEEELPGSEDCTY